MDIRSLVKKNHYSYLLQLFCIQGDSFLLLTFLSLGKKSKSGVDFFDHGGIFANHFHVAGEKAAC